RARDRGGQPGRSRRARAAPPPCPRPGGLGFDPPGPASPRRRPPLPRSEPARGSVWSCAPPPGRSRPRSSFGRAVRPARGTRVPAAAALPGGRRAAIIPATYRSEPNALRREAMPNITIQWYAGRTDQQKREITAAITDAMVKMGKTTADQVHIVFQDVEKSNWGVNGKLASD